jgi:hypothetical protein
MQRIIVRPIFQMVPGGNWWAYSFLKENTCSSLHTRDRRKAQALYDRRLAALREGEKV